MGTKRCVLCAFIGLIALSVSDHFKVVPLVTSSVCSAGVFLGHAKAAWSYSHYRGRYL